MSWDVLVFNFGGAPPPTVLEMTEAGDGWRPPTMGTAAQLRARISAVLPSVCWNPLSVWLEDTERREASGLSPLPMPGTYVDITEGYVLEFFPLHNASDDETLHCFTIAVRGTGNPLPLLS